MIKLMSFNTESGYILAERLFDEPEIVVLAEINEENKDDAEQEERVRSAAAEYFGKGVCIYSAKWTGHPGPDGEDEKPEIRLESGGVNYDFYTEEVLAVYPRIEGSFHPGIYREDFAFYKIESVRDLSEMFADSYRWAMPHNKYKLVCRADAVDIIVFTGNERDDYSLKVPVYPLTYFDLFCPLCSKQIIFCKLIDNASAGCFYEIDECSHYLGRCLKLRDRYLLESLDNIQCEYRLEEGEILAATADGWQKPLIFIPPFDPGFSYWGKSSGEESDDAFLFLDDG